MNLFTKWSFTILLSLLVCFPDSSAVAQTIGIRDGRFSVDTVLVTGDLTRQDMEVLLGKPDRITRLANEIWTYDSLGIYLYFNQQSISQFCIDLKKGNMRFSPVHTYKGKLQIQGHDITSAFPLSRMKEVPGLRFEQNPLNSYPAFSGVLKMYFDYSRDDLELMRLNIVLKARRGQTIL